MKSVDAYRISPYADKRPRKPANKKSELQEKTVEMSERMASGKHSCPPPRGTSV